MFQSNGKRRGDVVRRRVCSGFTGYDVERTSDVVCDFAELRLRGGPIEQAPASCWRSFDLRPLD